MDLLFDRYQWDFAPKRSLKVVSLASPVLQKLGILESILENLSRIEKLKLEHAFIQPGLL